MPYDTPTISDKLNVSMGLRLQRTFIDSAYAVPETPWFVQRTTTSPYCWHITPDHMVPDIQRKWEVRHRAVYEARFATLRQAREYLEALLATDPPPSPVAEAQVRLTSLGPGHYRVVATREDRSVEAALTLRENIRGWELARGSHLVGYFATLHGVKSRAARLMFDSN